MCTETTIFIHEDKYNLRVKRLWKSWAREALKLINYIHNQTDLCFKPASRCTVTWLPNLNLGWIEPVIK